MRWMDESYLIESTPKAWEFYDLKKDPEEMVNRYDDPAYRDIVAQLKAKLQAMRTELKETDEAYPHLDKVIRQYWE